jgi:formylglycine-generating enzyme required for sulfatase activity
MDHLLQKQARWWALLMVAVVMVVACGVPVATDPTPTVSPAGIELTAREIRVERHREEQITDLPKNHTVDIQENDRIAVAEKGLGLLRFVNLLSIELHHETEMHLTNVSLDLARGSIFLRLKQIIGTTRVELTEQADARVQLETDYATMTSGDLDDSPTVFMVCHAPEQVTCMVTVEGEVVVEAQGEAVRVPARHGTYIFPGKPPQPPVCIDLNEFASWLDRQRRAEEGVEPLVVLVQAWAEADLCPAVAAATAGIPAGEGMVLIPAGLYEVGQQQADEYHLAAMQVELEAFWIDVYEVTNAQYHAFVNATGQAVPAEWPGGVYPAGREAHPVRGVTWDSANAYCTWAQKRLPREAEWEAAGRGPEKPPPLFPWGSDSLAGGELDKLPLNDTYEVGTAAFNRSPVGVYDMAANVWEWVGEPYGPVGDGIKILRGGRYGFPRDMAYRQQATADDQRFVSYAGFRCAADQVEGG